MQKEEFVRKHKQEIFNIDFKISLAAIVGLLSVLNGVQCSFAKTNILNFEKAKDLEDSVRAVENYSKNPLTGQWFAQ